GCYASLFNLSRPEMARAASRATRRPRVTRQLEELQNAPFDRLAAQQLRQHSAVPQVLDILGRVDSRQHLELRDLAILRRADLEHLAGLEPGGQPAYGKRLAAREPETRAILPVLELQREYAHPEQVAPMNSLEAFRDHRADTEQLRALGRPVARRARTILLAREHDQRHPFGAITLGRFVDRGTRAVRQMDRDTALDPRHELISEPDIGERPTHHHFMITA